MLRRQRPGGGRHPPPLTPTVSKFKPRAQWNNSGSSIILYVNLPGFYRDQVEIKKDEKTRAIYIQGQRPLSTHTKARFNEVYRVPESCDMTKLNTSFSHGLLTIEFPAVVEGEKTEKAGKQFVNISCHDGTLFELWNNVYQLVRFQRNEDCLIIGCALQAVARFDDHSLILVADCLD
ncbi:hypothetical protein F2Q68_00032991 [Brassica cretica]|uniref:SHSP domain-containing protein n=1 Tax=Brassica cretica TaxID=69181 RepID=A0A8S9GEJ2_BRACR|nr:hypothetical protein F2Q68_00032991 [Brassica cretica]